MNCVETSDGLSGEDPGVCQNNPRTTPNKNPHRQPILL